MKKRQLILSVMLMCGSISAVIDVEDFQRQLQESEAHPVLSNTRYTELNKVVTTLKNEVTRIHQSAHDTYKTLKNNGNDVDRTLETYHNDQEVLKGLFTEVVHGARTAFGFVYESLSSLTPDKKGYRVKKAAFSEKVKRFSDKAVEAETKIIEVADSIKETQQNIESLLSQKDQDLAAKKESQEKALATFKESIDPKDAENLLRSMQNKQKQKLEELTSDWETEIRNQETIVSNKTSEKSLIELRRDALKKNETLWGKIYKEEATAEKLVQTESWQSKLSASADNYFWLSEPNNQTLADELFGEDQSKKPLVLAPFKLFNSQSTPASPFKDSTGAQAFIDEEAKNEYDSILDIYNGLTYVHYVLSSVKIEEKLNVQDVSLNAGYVKPRNF